MDFALFDSLIRNLLQMNVYHTDCDPTVWRKFEEKYCYNPLLQPAFTEETLSRLVEEMQENTMYGLQDELGVCVLLFRFAGQRYLVGPFVRREFDADRVQRLLIKRHVPASFVDSIRMYHAGFPMIGSTSVRKALMAFIRSFRGTADEYDYCRLQDTASEVAFPQPLREESLDYSSLYHRYDLENTFLRLVEQGDTENVMTALHNMSLQGMGRARYVSAIYQDPQIGNAMLRALARKAAERGGASLVEIHEITQRGVQKMVSARSNAELGASNVRMIYELTDAVRRSRETLGMLTPPVRRVVEYIRLNYSQELSLGTLAEIAGLSESYLTRTFKKEVGQTVFQYAAQLRCRKAADMLRSTELAIAQISSYVGYEDNNYFVKVFKKQYGVTPSEYRAGKGQ